MIGSKLGPYEIRAEIGQGGMATVYLAYQPTVDRDVAIKVIHSNFSSDTGSVQRFQREARLIARLEHPHILPVYDFDVVHDPPYIVMRYVDGGTLKELLGRGTPPLDQISTLLSQIAAALDYAHQRHVIHRDIKPSNILLDQSGNAFVADFGIARVVNQPGQSSTLTQPGAAIGTPGYMAPEQSVGTEHLTSQADIYSLGVMFFEIVTGQMPYTADNSADLILKHIYGEIPVATVLNPRLSPAVDGVIARAMAKNPIDRFASATHFAQAAIEALHDSDSVPSNQPVASAQQAKPYGVSFTADANDKTDHGSMVGVGQKDPTTLHLSLSLLGSVQVTLNGQPLAGPEFNGVRPLLVFLVMERDRPHLRETLAEMLWPAQPEKKGRDSLRNALSKLRLAIEDENAEPSFLLKSRETLQFNSESHFTLDADEFRALIAACDRHPHSHIESCAECVQRLEKAAELYRGVFAQDLVLPDKDEYQNWLALKREAFQSQALDAFYIVAAYYEQQGAYDLARRYAWRQIEIEPWREEAFRQLMRLLALSGLRTAALAQYERCCRILHEELDVDPSPETMALNDQIRAGEIKPVHQYADSPAIIRRANVPTAPTSFVGRQKELELLLQYLADPACRLVTIFGLGGMGKTRLALETTRQAADLFQDVCFISLASLNSADLIPSAIADALRFSTTQQDDFAAQLINYLSDKNLLLTLDNMEHLTDGLNLLGDIVTEAPGVKLLVTSREKLNLQGEWVLPLQGLPITEHEVPENAIALFVQRAKMARSDFVYSTRDQPTILRICQLVDGMPLGIELAAAWMQMLTCQEIAEGITANLSFLSTSARDLPERHQSLRAVFEHSWTLLSPEQQRVFRALSVFRGGFQADAALEIAGAGLPTLLAFVSKSILHRDPGGRYQIHELLRQYALEKLDASGETEQVLTRHLRFFVNLAGAAELQIRGGQQIPWLERLEAENDNLRTALQFARANQFAEIGLQLASSLWFFWHVRNYFHEGLEWLQQLITAVPDVPTPLRARALFAAGWLAQSNRDLSLAAELSQASLQAAQEIGDIRSIAYPLSTLAWLAYFQGEYSQATTLGEESLTLFRKSKDSWGIVHTLNILGYIAESRADYAHAEILQREGINVARAAGDNDSLGWSLYLLGRVMAERSKYEEAIQLCNQSLDIYRELGNRWSVALVLYTLGDSAMALGDLEKAASLAEESANLLREMSDYWAIGGPLSCLGMVAYRQGDLARAGDFAKESLLYFRQFGDKRGMAYALNTLGCIAQEREQNKEASDLFKESLTLREGSGIRRGMAICFERLAEIAVEQGEAERAATLLGAAENLRETIDAFMPGDDLGRHSRCVEAVRLKLGDSAFMAVQSMGRALPLADALAYAHNSPAEST